MSLKMSTPGPDVDEDLTFDAWVATWKDHAPCVDFSDVRAAWLAQDGRVQALITRVRELTELLDGAVERAEVHRLRVAELESVVDEALRFVGHADWEYEDGEAVNTKRWRKIAKVK